MIDAFGIFHNKSCLLELRWIWYQATEYAILLLLSQAIILIFVTLVSNCYKLFSASDPPLLIKTIHEKSIIESHGSHHRPTVGVDRTVENIAHRVAIMCILPPPLLAEVM